MVNEAYLCDIAMIDIFYYYPEETVMMKRIAWSLEENTNYISQEKVLKILKQGGL